MMELWAMQNTPSLPSFPSPLCLGVVAPDGVLSMGQTKLNCNYAKVNVSKLTVFTFKLRTYAKLNC